MLPESSLPLRYIWERAKRKKLLRGYNAIYTYTLDFDMNLDKEQTTEVKGLYQTRKGIIL